jgi:hypothetical protein
MIVPTSSSAEPFGRRKATRSALRERARGRRIVVAELSYSARVHAPSYSSTSVTDTPSAFSCRTHSRRTAMRYRAQYSPSVALRSSACFSLALSGMPSTPARNSKSVIGGNSSVYPKPWRTPWHCRREPAVILRGRRVRLPDLPRFASSSRSSLSTVASFQLRSIPAAPPCSETFSEAGPIACLTAAWSSASVNGFRSNTAVPRAADVHARVRQGVEVPGDHHNRNLRRLGAPAQVHDGREAIRDRKHEIQHNDGQPGGGRQLNDPSRVIEGDRLQSE